MIRKKRIVLNTSCKEHTGTKYQIVKEVAHKIFGWRTTDLETGDWDVFWIDTSIKPERLSQMKNYQKINHFPGMQSIARKNTLAIHLNKLREIFPTEYNFYPQTWVLPLELNEFKNEVRTKRGTYIVKPEASCQGNGIYLVKKIENLNDIEHSIVEKYIKNPLLIDGFKFDLRLYVLITGCDPLRIFVHEEGLVRLATEAYRKPSQKNIGLACMHLTNYAVNKTNPKFVNNEEVNDYSGHKRSLSSFWEHLRENNYDVNQLWKRICDLVVKSLLVVEPEITHIYKSCQPNDISNSMCFEILGFDVIVTENLKPILLEINHSPSFTTDSQLDYEIKEKIIKEALVLMNISRETKKRGINMEREIVRMRTTGALSFHETKNFIRDKRKKSALTRNRWENKTDTGYEKIYPDPEYEYLVSAAEEMWRNFTKTKRPATSSRMKLLNESRTHNRRLSENRESDESETDKTNPFYSLIVEPQMKKNNPSGKFPWVSE